MGETAAATVTEIAQTRERLDSELRELESYVPATLLWAKRVAGAIVAGGATTSIVLFALRHRRRRDTDHRLHDIERRLRRVERDAAIR